MVRLFLEMGKMTFELNKENSDLMEFSSENTNVYLNETSDKHLVITPIKASCLTINYKDFKGNIHKIEGVLYGFISDYRDESK